MLAHAHGPVPVTARATSAAAFVCVFLALVAGCWIALDRTLTPALERLDAQQYARAVARVHANIEALANELVTRTNDYATWDDTYRYVNGRQPDYIANNFDDAWFDAYDVDLLVFVDADRRIAWGRDRASETGPLADRRAIYNNLRRDAGLAGASVEHPAAGILWRDQGPLLYAARPATMTNGSGEPSGLVVLGRRLSVAELSARADLPLVYLSTEDAQRDPAASAALAAFSASSAPEHAAGGRTFLALRAPDGTPVALIVASQSHSISAIGAHAIRLASMIFAAFAALALLLLWLYLFAKPRAGNASLRSIFPSARQPA